jgi:molybdate transport system ATP-binding protein
LPSRSESGLEIELAGLSLHRDGRKILEEIQWTLRPGERWVLIGANGAGKTQLLKIMAGAVWPDPESLAARRYLWRRCRVELVDVIDRIAYLGPERQDRHERHDWNFSALQIVGTGLTRSDLPQGPLRPRQIAKALAGLAAVGLARLAERRFLQLSFGERRLVLLARLLATQPSWLLLDELLAGLDERHRRQTLRFLDRHPGSWVLSTHRREEIPQSATHLAEICAGRLLRAGPIEARDRRPRRRSRRKLSSGSSPQRSMKTRAMLVACEQADIYLDYRRVLQGLEFAVRGGECWVVHGGNGAGKSTLLRALYGDHPPALGGRIRRRGIEPGVPLAEFRRWCAIVAPHLQSNPPVGETVLDTIVSGLRSSIGLDTPSTPAERRRALALLHEIGLGERAAEPLRALSYGQARRVLLARGLVLRPRLLLLDEVFAGIDVETRAWLQARIERFVAAGGAVVLTSHHRDEWPRNATHEIELRRGKVQHAGVVRRRLATGSRLRVALVAVGEGGQRG